MDSYFATVEQQANSHLRGKPIGIIKAVGRGCVIAASNEAKVFGVRTGMGVWDAKKLCPGIVLIPSDMDKYFSLTKRMIEIVERYSPEVEVFSIDEVFADVTDTQKLFHGGLVEMVYEIKRDISLELGGWIKCSVGVSFNRLVAKLASGMNKPNGLTILTLDNYLNRTEDVDVGEVCGVGLSRARYLYDRGLFTLGKARKVDLPTDIADLVWLRGSNELVTNGDLVTAKSVSRTYTAYVEFENINKVRKLVRNLVEEVAEKLREMKMQARSLGLFLKAEGSNGRIFRVALDRPTNDGLIIFDCLWLKYTGNPVLPVRFVGIYASNLEVANQAEMLWEMRRRTQLMNVVDCVNKRNGLFSIYPASIMGCELVRPEVTGFLGDKWYRFGGRKRT